MSQNAVKLNTYEKARAQMLIKHPFFAAIVLSTEWVESKTIPTMCTDMKKVWYNPDFANSLSVDECMFVLIHEISHIINLHGIRRGRRKPIRANKAMDYAINQELVDTGLKMPAIGLIDARFKGMAFEQIYDVLTMEKQQGKGKKPGKGGAPGGGGGGGGQPDDDDDIEDLGQMGQDVMDAISNMTQAEVNTLKEEIKQKIAQAATMARAAGKMPANLQLLVDGILNPPQPWEIILREYMTRMVMTNETWARRNRRFSTILPTRHDVGMGELVIIGDTSGSMMGDKIFAQLAQEINHCNEYVRPERTRVIWADAQASAGEQVFEPGEEVKLEPKGGGGTDMRLPLKHVEQYDPCCVILVTDCYTPWPETPCPFPVILASTTKVPGPDWMHRLELRDNEE